MCKCISLTVNLNNPLFKKVNFVAAIKRFSGEWRYQFVHSLNQYTLRFLRFVFCHFFFPIPDTIRWVLAKFEQLFCSGVLPARGFNFMQSHAPISRPALMGGVQFPSVIQP